MNRRIRRIALPIGVALAALSAAPGASANAAAHCANVGLAPTSSLQTGSQGITLTGTGTCTGGGSATESATLTLTGTATISNCFHNPYIDVTGTLTTRLADGTTSSSAATLDLAPDAGVSTGLGSLTTAAGQRGVFTVNYSDVPDDSGIGLISRCGGGEFTFAASGTIV